MRNDIKNSDLVLEVGSGDFPSYFSDVLVDKYPNSNFQRNKDIWLDKRLFIAADAQRLPFRDKAFDYVIAGNVLPYIERPEMFFRELMRVAPRGVIIAISEIFDRLRDIPFHKWYVNMTDAKPVLKKKEKPNREFGKLFHFLCEKDRLFFKFLNKHWFLFNLIYNWERCINYEIVRPDTKVIDLEEPKVVEELIRDKRRRLSRIVNLFLSPGFKNFILDKSIKFKKRIKKLKFADILICLVCGFDVVVEKTNIRCKNCNKLYPIKKGIPYMFIDE